MASTRQINNGKKKQLTRGGYATKRETLNAGTNDI